MQQDSLIAAQKGPNYDIIAVPSYNFCFKSADDGTPVDVFFILSHLFDSAEALFRFRMWPKLMQSTESAADSAVLTMPLMSDW